MDNSATSYPKPECVIKAVESSMLYSIANPGRSSHKQAVKTASSVFKAREVLSTFVNTSPENIVFTYNATYALNMAIFGAVRSGDRVVTSIFEHNSVLRPLWSLENNKGIRLSFLNQTTDDTNVLAEQFKALVKSKEKPDVLVLTHTSNVTGAKLPVRTIGKVCQKYGITFILDASQGLGTSRVDMEKDCVDILCASGHKGLYGIMGSGFLAVSKSFSGKISPLIFGGTGIFSKDTSMPSSLPERLEAGTVGVVGIESMRAGVEYINKVTPEALQDKCHRARVRLSEGLSVIRGVNLFSPNVDSTSIVLFNMTDVSSEKVALMLDEYDIACRSGFHCAPLIHEALGTGGAVRLSVGAFNTLDECDKTLLAIEEIAKRV